MPFSLVCPECGSHSVFSMDYIGASECRDCGFMSLDDNFDSIDEPYDESGEGCDFPEY